MLTAQPARNVPTFSLFFSDNKELEVPAKSSCFLITLAYAGREQAPL